jgi:cell division protein FtsB
MANPRLLIGGLFLCLFVIACWILYSTYTGAIHDAEAAKLSLASERQKLASANQEIEAANSNLNTLAADYNTLKATADKAREDYRYAIINAKKRESQLKSTIDQLSSSGGDIATVYNERMRQATERINGYEFEHSEAVSKTDAANAGSGDWYCFDEVNAQALISNMQRAADYIELSEGDANALEYQ